jgi:hypothetical protein
MFKPLADVVDVNEKEAAEALKSAANREQARLLAIKQALLVTAGTPGWQYIKQMAVNIVNRMTTNALNAKREDRDDEIAKAKAAREIFQELFTVIETTMTFGTEEEPEWFSNLGEMMEVNATEDFNGR